MLEDTGLRKFPFHQFVANQVWLELVLAAQDLLTFFQWLCLDGEARNWEPKTLRHRLLHVAGRVARSGRRVYLRLQSSWRWTVPSRERTTASGVGGRTLPSPTPGPVWRSAPRRREAALQQVDVLLGAAPTEVDEEE